MKLSVAVWTFNGEKYISEQLNSIINQTLAVNEIIICDDQSSDSTIEIINSFIEKYPTLIKLYQNKINLNVNKNFEKAITLSTGDYIFLSDQDDVWEKNKVFKIMEIFNSNKNAEGVFSNGYLINDCSEKVVNKSLWENVLFLEHFIKSPADLYNYGTTIRNMVTGATLCIKKETKEFIFPFPKTNSIYHDEWIALILSYRKTLLYSREKLISYRIHSNQQIGVTNPIKLKENTIIINSILNKTKKIKYKHLYLIYKSYFRNYNKFTALKKNYIYSINFDIDFIINNNKQYIIEINKKMKKSSVFLYYLNKFKDKIANKRQLN